jgi:hypothetical protein
VSWYCACGLHNSGLNKKCADQRCNQSQISSNTPDYLQYLVTKREVESMSILTERERKRLEAVREHLRNGTSPYETAAITKLNIGEKREVIIKPRVEFVIPENKGMTEQEKLFAEFYQKGRALVKDMDDMKLRETRADMSRIVFEGKAYLVSYDDEARERKAKNGNAQQWLTTDTNPNVIASDAIAAVKIRKERMTKLDRYKKDLLKIGMDENIVNEMVKNLEKGITEANLKTVNFGTKQIQTKPDPIQVIADKTEKLIAELEPEPDDEVEEKPPIKFGNFTLGKK